MEMRQPYKDKWMGKKISVLQPKRQRWVND